MNTSTVPNLALAWNALTAAMPSTPTVAIGDLAWSDEETVVRPVPSVPPLSRRRGSASLLAAITSVLLGVISVAAALGVLAFDSSGVPRDGSRARRHALGPRCRRGAQPPNMATCT